jgi:galactokinase
MNERAIADRLIESGVSSGEACNKGRCFALALANLEQFSAATASDPYLLFVPGRIELLGKHTDYAGGRSVLATAERGFCITATARNDNCIHILDATSDDSVSFKFGPELTPGVGHWSNYPMTVARRVARNFPGPWRGADIAFISDLPPAAGMSSSSAMITGFFKVLSHVNRLVMRQEYKANFPTPEALAGYLATIENGHSFGPLRGDRGVGTFGGSEDHTAICCCRPGRFHVYSFCPVKAEQTIELPPGYIMAIAASGVLAEKTGEAMAKYNRASRLVSALLELWQAQTSRNDRCLADAVHSEPDAAGRLRRIIAEHPHACFDSAALLRRLEQFLGENERIVPAASRALAQRQMDVFGRLVDDSQYMAEQLLENQVPHTIYLARSARQCGADAASSFGAGFGGSVWAMVRAGAAEDFLAAWARGYRNEFPAAAERSSFFLTAAGPALIEL